MSRERAYTTTLGLVQGHGGSVRWRVTVTRDLTSKVYIYYYHTWGITLIMPRSQVSRL